MPTKPAALATSSPVALAALLRSGAGVHADQNRRKNPRAIRREGKRMMREES